MTKTPRNFKDITGMRYGRLQVLARAPNSEKGATRWLCRCDCGTETVAFAANLGRPNTTSCGCLRDRLSVARAITHGRRKSPEYRVWSGMITRCTNPNEDCYANYGGRGISVCQQWRTSFAAFYADMGPRPTPAHSIERIDNDGDYEPGNCRWATPLEQGRNKRNNVMIDIRGEKLCFSEACRKYGVNRLRARNRLFDLGWSIEEAFNLAPRQRMRSRA